VIPSGIEFGTSRTEGRAQTNFAILTPKKNIYSSTFLTRESIENLIYTHKVHLNLYYINNYNQLLFLLIWYGFPAASNEEFQNQGYDFETFFGQKIETKKADNTYRVFKKVNRLANNFPHARSYMDNLVDSEKVMVWCSNDYLGMSRHPEVLEVAR